MVVYTLQTEQWWCCCCSKRRHSSCSYSPVPFYYYYIGVFFSVIVNAMDGLLLEMMVPEHRETGERDANYERNEKFHRRWCFSHTSPPFFRRWFRKSKQKIIPQESARCCYMGNIYMECGPDDDARLHKYERPVLCVMTWWAIDRWMTRNSSTMERDLWECTESSAPKPNAPWRVIEKLDFESYSRISGK